MATRRRRRSIPTKGAAPRLALERELICIARAEVGLRAELDGTASVEGTKVTSLNKVLSTFHAELRPLFGLSEDRLKHETATVAALAGVEVPNLSIYYRVVASEERLEAIAARLRKVDEVETAYIKPAAEPAEINDMAPSAGDAPPVTPDFTPRQGYLEPAPTGVDARYAWTLAGGRGRDVRVIDIEGAWRFTHEDLTQNQGGVVGGTPSPDPGWRNHGTAVIGEIGGDLGGFGITGISADAMTSAVSIFGGGMGSAAAIRHAASRLRAGDIILIELHRPGPRHGFAGRSDQRGYIAIEWWPDDFDAIRFATSRGILVAEAAGNGAENLDDPLYSVRPASFPSGWTNPFNRSNRDSGAIVVGAGAPPPGTHSADHGPDRSRLDFSNYGALVDAQGWGREVTTCGYGDLQGGANEDLWYTDRFSGTSSASPIVVGTLACVQGVLRARGQAPMNPARARQCLRSTGSPQQDAPGRPRTQRIGTRPNLRQLIPCALGKTTGKEGKEIKELKEHHKEKEFKEFKENRKELKDKDFKETKEKDRKEFKDIKEFKEKDKDKDIFEGIFRPIEGSGESSSLSDRLSQLESVVGQLAHFIGHQLRPDLGAGALSCEPDCQGQGQGKTWEAKTAKDSKDLEKQRES